MTKTHIRNKKCPNSGQKSTVYVAPTIPVHSGEEENPNRLNLRPRELKRYQKVVALRIALWGHPAGKIRWVNGVPQRAIDYPEQVADPGRSADKIEASRLNYDMKKRKTRKENQHDKNTGQNQGIAACTCTRAYSESEKLAFISCTAAGCPEGDTGRSGIRRRRLGVWEVKSEE